MNILLSLDLWHFMLREMNVLFSAVEKMILLGCGFICEDLFGDKFYLF